MGNLTVKGVEKPFDPGLLTDEQLDQLWDRLQKRLDERVITAHGNYQTVVHGGRCDQREAERHAYYDLTSEFWRAGRAANVPAQRPWGDL